jgi:hypothetical protein
MHDFPDRLRRSQAQVFQRTIKPVLLAVAFLWALIGMSAWLFDHDDNYMLLATLGVLLLGLVTGTFRLMARTRAGGPPQNTPLWSSGVSRPPEFSADTDERVATLGGKRWSLEVFAAIDAQRFAAVCETWFSWAGFETRSETHRTNEGVDIWLHAARVPGPVAIVRCRHWLNKPVGLQDMKEFLGLVATCKSAHGTFTTTSTYTPEALQFARENGIDAVDGRNLLRRIQTRTRQRQQALLAVAYHVQS